MTRKIILASKSKARKDLLKQIGLKFKVIEAKIKEKKGVKQNCKDLVIANAWAKGQDVAKKINSGIIIAADTLVLSGKQKIGKPKNISQAIRILRLLSRKPQLVYTGLVVIDVDNKKIFKDYAKTKIYMRRLSDEQINNYFKQVSPLNKAGGFDIMGLGGIFVDHIDGCFYNVVGLPLSKLVKILERLGVKVI